MDKEKFKPYESAICIVFVLCVVASLFIVPFMPANLAKELLVKLLIFLLAYIVGLLFGLGSDNLEPINYIFLAMSLFVVFLFF